MDNVRKAATIQGDVFAIFAEHDEMMPPTIARRCARRCARSSARVRVATPAHDAWQCHWEPSSASRPRASRAASPPQLRLLAPTADARWHAG